MLKSHAQSWLPPSYRASLHHSTEMRVEVGLAANVGYSALRSLERKNQNPRNQRAKVMEDWIKIWSNWSEDNLPLGNSVVSGPSVLQNRTGTTNRVEPPEYSTAAYCLRSSYCWELGTFEDVSFSPGGYVGSLECTGESPRTRTHQQQTSALAASVYLRSFCPSQSH